MPAKDIYESIAKHQLDGIMFHDAMMDYFLKLDMCGFYAMAKKQFLSEMGDLIETKKHYRDAYDMILKVEPSDYRPDILDETWFVEETLLDKDETVAAVQKIFTAWQNWEKKTHNFYIDIYTKARNENEPDAAGYSLKLYNEVNDELHRIKQWIMKLTSYDYDPKTIYDMQIQLAKMY